LTPLQVAVVLLTVNAFIAAEHELPMNSLSGVGRAVPAALLPA
jgi:hypothetical protein